MSPIPGPGPRSSGFVGLLLSPPVLMLGFVALLVATCPGARGDSDGGLYAMVMSDGLPVVATDELSGLNVAVPPTKPTVSAAPLTTVDRSLLSTVRTLCSSSQDRRPQPAAGTFALSKAVLPLLVDPIFDVAPHALQVAIVPMTGPAVGVKLRVGGKTR